MGLGSEPLLGALEWLAWPLTLGVLAGLVDEVRAWRGQAPSPRPFRPRLLALAALLVAATFGGRALSLFSSPGPDFFGAKEAAATACLGLGAVWLGFTFAARVWAALARLLPGATAALAIFLLINLGSGGSGLLGNTGYDMQLLLPGAVVGFLLWSGDPKRLAGLLAFAGSALFAALAPVLGGLLVLLVITSLALVRSLRTARAERRRILGAFIVSLFLCAARLAPLPTTPSPTTGAAASSPGETGGVGVRLHIWKSLPVTAHGFGVGQFQALYPPFRDPLELEATTGGHTIEAVTEVEHPHNDLLLVLAEDGWRGAFPLGLALLILAALALRRQVSPQTSHEPALASGALVVVLMGAFHAPLFANPAGAALGGLLFGIFAGEGNEASAARPTWVRGARLGAGMLVLVFLIAALVWRPIPMDRAAESPTLASLDAAREATHDGRLSFDLIAARARSIEEAKPAAAWWRLGLELRPHSIEALAGLGMSEVKQHQLLAAKQAWTRALELDPAYPVVKNNLERLGADLILAGHLGPGLELLGPRLAQSGLASPPGPKDLEAHAEGERPPFKTALLAAAAWLHGRELFEAGSTSKALFELRRAAVLAGHGAEPKAGLGAEIAVLESLEGQVAQARDRLARLGDTEAEREELIAELPERLQGAARLLWR